MVREFVEHRFKYMPLTSPVKHYQQQTNAFPSDYVNKLWREIQACPYFAIKLKTCKK
jgi:hypothetical protein